MSRLFLFLIFIFASQICLAQTDDKSMSLQDEYFQKQKEIALEVSDYIYSDFSTFNAMGQSRFTKTIDSLRAVFLDHLSSYSESLPQHVIEDEQVGIKYFFDMLLLDYPANHETYTGERISLSDRNQSRLNANIADFNKEALLSNRDFRMYIRAFLSHQINKELDKQAYIKHDNQRLHAVWNLIDQWFDQQGIKDYWRYTYFKEHIENMGIKNTQDFYDDFITSSENTTFVKDIRELHESHEKGRDGHLIKTYKTVDGFQLDMHLFLPDTAVFKGNRPVIVYFHGGSWSEGKPDWFFNAGNYYANEGWVAAAVEYRIKARHNTLPFASVKDARSAIRWLREHAKTYQIDPSKIVATGNSAGGHLVLATALANKWNEETDNLEISPTPNALMITSGVYDLTVDNSKWIGKDVENKDLVKEISPNHLLRNNLPPTLIIHGENDMNCPYSTAEYFVNEMTELGNDIEFYTIKGAGHFIWYGKHAGQVSQIKSKFLEKIAFK